MARRKKGALGDAEIETLLQRFISGEMRVYEGEQAIERFRASKERVLPRLLEMIRDPEESVHTVAAELLIALEDRSIVRPLLKFFDDPTLNDWCKLSIFSVLQRFDVPVDLEALYRRLQDPDAIARRAQENLLDSFTHASELTQFLNIITKHVPLEDRPEMIYRLVETEDPRVLFPLRAVLHMPEEAVVLAAIEGLNVLRAVVAIPWLEKLAQYGPTKLIRQEASKVAGHLTMRASVPGASVIREMPPLADAQWPLHSCWLTTIDGAGGQIALVARERPDGFLVIADIMFTDQEGLKDCFGADMMDAEEFEGMLDELTSEGIVAVEVRLERCREAVERAYEQALALGRRLPLEYFAWEGMLVGEDPRSVEEWPVEEVDITAHPELLTNSIELLTLEEMESWFFNPEEIEAFTKRHRHLLWRSPISGPKILQVLSQVVGSVVDEGYRALLRDRLRRQAWLLAQIYADKEVWQWAMAASAGLEEGGPPATQHPLLLGMMAASLDNVLGTDLLEEILGWDEETWLDILAKPPPSQTTQPAPSEWAKLCSFLRETELEVPTSLVDLMSADEPQSLLKNTGRAWATLRALNWLESIFDEDIEDYFYEAGGLDWRKLREELGLIPAADMKSSVLQRIEADFTREMELEGCSKAMIARARQLWDDYIFLTQGQVAPLRKPESWAAGIHYLVSLLYFDWLSQTEVGDLYGVSAGTVSKRYRILFEELDVRIFRYPFEKGWHAIEKLEDLARLSPDEIFRRLFGRFNEPLPWEDGGWE